MPDASHSDILCKERVHAADEYIQCHFRSNAKVNLVAVARQAHMSPFHFHRMYKRLFGITFKNRIDQLRLAEAKRLLMEGVPSTEIHEACGWLRAPHFCSRFKKLTGMTPLQWKAAEMAQRQPR
jgi:AraC-like DNA-binding protein